MTLEPVKLNIGNGNRVVPIEIRSRATVQEPEPEPQEEEFEFPSTFPNDFMCPISYDIMTDPVILAGSGQTYERAAIEQWFRMGRRSCPTTKINLSKAAARQLISNRALKNVIEDFLKEWRAARGTSETKKKAEKKK
jgi:hypothetical protein